MSLKNIVKTIIAKTQRTLNRFPESWKKRKSILINALGLDLIVYGVYHLIAKNYGWFAGSYLLAIINFIIGIPLLIYGIKTMRIEFKLGGWNTENCYMLTKAYEKRLKKLGLESMKWSSKLGKGYVWRCAEREQLFRRLEREGKLEEVVNILKDDKLAISNLIKDLTGGNYNEASDSIIEI